MSLEPCSSRGRGQQNPTTRNRPEAQAQALRSVVVSSHSSSPRDYLSPGFQIPSPIHSAGPGFSARAMAGAAAGAEAVERAHGLYRGGRHREALELYSAALAAARGPAQRIALHSNRAACYLKLHDFHKVPPLLAPSALGLGCFPWRLASLLLI